MTYPLSLGAPRHCSLRLSYYVSARVLLSLCGDTILSDIPEHFD